MVRKPTETEWVNLDALTYAGRSENTEAFADTENYRFAHGLMEDGILAEALFSESENYDASIRDTIDCYTENPEWTWKVTDGSSN